MYAEQRAEGKSPQVADLYATAYADQREKGKSHEYATPYAEQRAAGKSDIYATAYADQHVEGESHEYATAYADQRAEGESHEYATAYADQRAEDESHEYATAYAEQKINEGKSNSYAAKYAWVYDALRTGISTDVRAWNPSSWYGRSRSLRRALSVGFAALSHTAAKAYAETYTGAFVFYGSSGGAEGYTYQYHRFADSKTHDYAVAYADCGVRGCSEDVEKFAASYAAQREIGKSTPYAHAYALARAADKSPDVAKDEAGRFEAAFKDQLAKGSSVVNAYAGAIGRFFIDFAAILLRPD